jgi:acyl carrier protein
MSERIAETVVAALAKQLNLSASEVHSRDRDSLENLGLDSHGLLRVLIDVERALALPKSLNLPDEALESPRALIAGVAGAMAGS